MNNRAPKGLWNVLFVIVTIILFWGLVSWWRSRPSNSASTDVVERPRVSLPQFIRPVTGDEKCSPQVHPVAIPDSLRARDRVVVHGDGRYTLYWTGETPIREIFQGKIQRPEEAETIRLMVTPKPGEHFDVEGFWNPTTGEHLTAFVERGRNYSYGGRGYCPNRTNSYPLPRNFLNYVGPLQSGVIVDLHNPRKGVYPFSWGRVEIVIASSESPVLFFNNWNPTRGRLHAAEFSIYVQPL